jgi:3D (Asp-Asp-Asp) domain-containing protein
VSSFASIAPAVSAASGRTITVSATGYALPGRTSTGLPVGWGVVAVDPSVIPLGTHMTVPGYGEAVAADTGGAVTGSTIDLWFPTIAQANAWGRRVVTITLH